MSERVPMAKPASFMSGDFNATVSGPDASYGRRFSLIVAEEALRKMGPQAVAHFTEKLAQRVVHEHDREISEVLLSYLRDRAWAEPLIRQFLREAIRDYVLDVFYPNTCTEPQRNRPEAPHA